MDKYIHPLIIILALVVLGGLYLVSYREAGPTNLSSPTVAELRQYEERKNRVSNFNLETDILKSELYLSLIDEFKREVLQMDIGRVNPFRPIN